MKHITILSIIFIIIVISTCVFINLHNKQEESTTAPTKELGDNVENEVFSLTNTDRYKNCSSQKRKEMLADVLNQLVTSGKIKSYTIELDSENPYVSYTNPDDIRKVILLQPFKKNQN